MNRNQARSKLTQELLYKYPQHEASVLAQHLLMWALSEPLATLLAHPDEPLTSEQVLLIEQVLKEHLLDHKPLQYCIGTIPFLSATIRVRPPILIPRPETEWWVDLIIQQLRNINKPLTLLDMCTGSGCIAIALAQAFPHASVYAVDSEPKALELAQENAVLNKCPQITFIQSNLFEHVPKELRFDCIMSNPPYISESEYEELEPDVRLWEDPGALRTSEEGLFLIRHIIEQAPHWLTKEPLFIQSHTPQLALEIGETQAHAVSSLFRTSGFKPQVYKDLAHKDRLVTGEQHG